MKKQKMVSATEKKKALIISILYASTIIIMFLGIYLGVFSIVHNISFRVLNASVPGVIFGALVLYLGMKYFFSVDKLKTEIYKDAAKFSWSNFRKEKTKKVSLRK